MTRSTAYTEPNKAPGRALAQARPPTRPPESPGCGAGPEGPEKETRAMTIEKYAVLSNKDASIGEAEVLYDELDEARLAARLGEAIVAVTFVYDDNELVEVVGGDLEVAEETRAHDPTIDRTML